MPKQKVIKIYKMLPKLIEKKVIDKNIN